MDLVRAARRIAAGMLAAVLGVGAAASWAGEDRAPCAHRDPLRQPFFGDLHVHTALSLDASTQDTRTRPADAYRFAKGEPIPLQPYAADGRPLRTLRIDRPLHFAAVTDHAELLGETHICNTPGLEGYDSLVCRMYRAFPRLAFFGMNMRASSPEPTRFGFCGEDGERCLEAARVPWQETLRAAEDHYDRSEDCAFTTFVGYEWTGAYGMGQNAHRNVIFANDLVPDRPWSYVDGPRDDLLWSHLREHCLTSGTGCDAVVIPHNSNLSGGLMFQPLRSDGTPIDADDARLRAELEVLVEIYQHKGDSECHTGLGTEDEQCGFEKLAMNDFSGRFFPWRAKPPVASQFVRNALKEGLAEQARIGVNPFKLGIIGSTDTHVSASGAVAEDATFPGHGGAGAPAGEELPRGLVDDADFSPGGLAVLWAEENTREALFAAMKRREAYGTSGPRMVVRFFGGWDYAEDLCARADLAAQGYERGVPMGGDLPAPPVGSDAADARHTPVFAVSALRDPGGEGAPGAPLDRIQIVKGWIEGGELRERVYDVAARPDSEAGVDPDTCALRGTGADALCAVWRDPDFDATELAFYYARVLENPTCRWSARQCVANGVRCDDPATVTEGFEACCDPALPRTIRERAWTSPIWYTPEEP